MAPKFISSAVAGKQSAPKAPPRRRPAGAPATSNQAATATEPPSDKTRLDTRPAESSSRSAHQPGSSRTVTFAEPAAGHVSRPPAHHVAANEARLAEPAHTAEETTIERDDASTARQSTPESASIEPTSAGLAAPEIATFTPVNDQYRNQATEPTRQSRRLGAKRAAEDASIAQVEPPRKKRTSTRSSQRVQAVARDGEIAGHDQSTPGVSAKEAALAKARERGVNNADDWIARTRARTRTAKQKAVLESQNEQGKQLQNQQPVAAQRSGKKIRQKKTPVRVAEQDEAVLEGGEEVASTAEAEQPKRRPSKKRRKKGASTDENGDEGEDPETHEIDASKVTMFDLGYDRKIGKSSEREKKMSEIDWAEVVRKRREEAERIAMGQTNDSDAQQPAAQDETTQTNGDGQASPSAAQPDGEAPPDGEVRPSTEVQASPLPRSNFGIGLRLDAAGNIVEDEASLQIQRPIDTGADGDAVEVENDLTIRINRATHMNSNRRDPRDRVPMGYSKSGPWSDAQTDSFYEALSMWGTDFATIATLFPGKTRHQIKTKFTREERLDPERVNAAMIGKLISRPRKLEDYAAQTGIDLEVLNKYNGIKHAIEVISVDMKDKEAELQLAMEQRQDEERQREIQAAQKEKQKEAQEKKRQERRALSGAKRKGGLKLGTGTL